MADNKKNQSPFTRPGFIAAALVVAVIVIAGIVVGGLKGTGHRAPASSPPPSSPAAASSSAGSPDASVCGLKGTTLSGSVTSAPPVDEWQYQGTTAYPVSHTAGPGRTDTTGVRTCFQHSPAGAVFAAANAVAQGTDSGTAHAWLNYFVTGPARDDFLSTSSGTSTAAGARVQITGFRLLSYDAAAATVDMAVRGSSAGQSVDLSMVYQLVWESGDWKLTVADASTPIDVATLPALTGYILWGV